MSLVERAQLASVASFSERTPALPLLCHELDASARELLCLWPRDVAARSGEPLESDADAAVEYTQRKQRARLSFRAQLDALEETHVLR